MSDVVSGDATPEPCLVCAVWPPVPGCSGCGGTGYALSPAAASEAARRVRVRQLIAEARQQLAAKKEGR